MPDMPWRRLRKEGADDGQQMEMEVDVLLALTLFSSLEWLPFMAVVLDALALNDF